ncbi:putative G-patch domain protein [Aspergillus alliaceus]|uniref:putative G-patch domain protein n=1 Tax=Petromyces alliaceus TaxID=209559 RepID=UPI0012A743B1|nr:uncharacterized protein BDW43DRAFT_309138 [Aspergillus alliaceus]KAB8235808.1 hypothetical protein BDW43DRAFT_309138 [Aspergillus alliaceus]
MPDDNDDDYFLPVEAQRPFGAGIRRKQVPFVRSEHELNTTSTSQTAPAEPASSGPSIANTYLSIVLPKEKQASEPATPRISCEDGHRDSAVETVQSAPSSPSAVVAPRCDVCDLPIDGEGPTVAGDRPHEASLAHQVCLAHSHPPSHLDRTRRGLRYLAAYGWDPDSRVGLGVAGREGIREPLKGKVKADTVGLGAGDDGEGKEVGKGREVVRSAKVQKLNAKEVRRGHLEARKRGERLRELFYTSDEVLKYLGQ